MKKGLTEMVFILDRSGSMSGLESDTIGGFNSMLEKQKEAEGDAVVTTVLFDDQYELLHDRFPICDVAAITKNEYYVRGCTALLDAIGKTISKIGNVQKHLPDEARAEKVIFVITTDGQENSSRRFNYEQIRRKIEHQKEKYGWEFLFLGANIDAVSEARKMGIDASRAVRFENDSEGINLNYRVVSDAMYSLRCSDTIDDNWKQEIEEDFARRGRKNK